MNPFELDATGLLVWGVLAHLIADWLLQNDWMATNKARRRVRWNPASMTGERGTPYGVWWDRHPAAYVHAGIHGLLLAAVFGWPAAPLALVHLAVDTRSALAWWSELMRQTQPDQQYAKGWVTGDARSAPSVGVAIPRTVVDIGTLVRMANDQAFHVVCIAAAALLVG